MVSVSGGSDSDIVLDICYRCDKDNKCSYVWFDTGLEYQATKEHLKYLESKYNIEIKREKAIKPIPVSCREYGQPFLSKHVSDKIKALQKYNFGWENSSFEELYDKYPKCKSALEWWCNIKTFKAHNINQNKWLKEFLIMCPPRFKISNECCKYAKKDLSDKLIQKYGYELKILGIRKAEGGIRSTAYKTCFVDGWDYNTYMPVFWYKNKDKEEYNKHFNTQNSKCYTEYGLKRTGCACCPYGFYGGLKHELKITKRYEPKLHKAVCNVFHDSYEYTKQFEKFRNRMKKT